MLRSLQEGDDELLYKLFEPDKGATPFLDLPLGSRETFSRWLNEIQASEFLGFCLAHVIEASEKNVAGLILLTSIDLEAKSAEMGTWIGSAYRGTGLNEKAKRCLLQIAFEELELLQIHLWVAENNSRARKALEKLPFVRLADQASYSQEKKHRQFLFGQAFLVYEIEKKRWQLYSS
ncbi:GNAT family N-acetyltransferase [Ammoniphilus sp. YIM 78166]|uniref:GNAT family N-acetyltransferase n=1 Tax=Ammoniphilus sp. YIM 78166 TaxID=1644106 RepID=UPI00106F455C|nr:GNAT family N-acetyltransferase [Ammoniphilus sp. YIM 78166]